MVINVSVWRSELYTLSLVDYYSRWIEVLHVNGTTAAAACVAKMKDVFARFGFPEEIVSDNGPQFAFRNSDRLLRATGLLTQYQARSCLTRMGKGIFRCSNISDPLTDTHRTHTTNEEVAWWSSGL